MKYLDALFAKILIYSLCIGAAYILWGLWPQFAYGQFTNWQSFTKGNDTVHVGELCEQPYIPMGSPGCHPVAFTVPNDASQLWSVTANYMGWVVRPTACENPERRTPANHIQIDICPGHYPDLNAYGQPNKRPKGWNGKYGGYNRAWPLSAALSHVLVTWSYNIDWQTLVLQGQSYGGTGVLLLPGFVYDVEPAWLPNITMVSAIVPYILWGLWPH